MAPPEEWVRMLETKLQVIANHVGGAYGGRREV